MRRYAAHIRVEWNEHTDLAEHMRAVADHMRIPSDAPPGSLYLVTADPPDAGGSSEAHCYRLEDG